MISWLLDVLRFDWCGPAQLSVNQLWKSIGCNSISLIFWLVLIAFVALVISAFIIWTRD